jgi:hypothetical protein
VEVLLEIPQALASRRERLLDLGEAEATLDPDEPSRGDPPCVPDGRGDRAQVERDLAVLRGGGREASSMRTPAAMTPERLWCARCNITRWVTKAGRTMGGLDRPPHDRRGRTPGAPARRARPLPVWNAAPRVYFDGRVVRVLGRVYPMPPESRTLVLLGGEHPAWEAALRADPDVRTFVDGG